MELLIQKYVGDARHEGIYAKATPVTRQNWAQAKQIGQELVDWLDSKQGHFVGKYRRAWAISHGQVEKHPLSLFVVAEEFVGQSDGKVNQHNTMWPARIIFNPVILETPESFKVQMPKRKITPSHGKVEVETHFEEVKRSNLYKPAIKEACMSFPWRSGKHVERYFRIKVGYDIIGAFGRRKHVVEWIEGIKAHMFQHEYDHQQGKVMFYDKR